jgi:hypothetical protein
MTTKRVLVFKLIRDIRLALPPPPAAKPKLHLSGGAAAVSVLPSSHISLFPIFYPAAPSDPKEGAFFEREGSIIV